MKNTLSNKNRFTNICSLILFLLFLIISVIIIFKMLTSDIKLLKYGIFFAEKKGFNNFLAISFGVLFLINIINIFYIYKQNFDSFLTDLTKSNMNLSTIDIFILIQLLNITFKNLFKEVIILHKDKI